MIKAFYERLSARERKILYVVIALLGVTIGYHGVLRPMAAKFSTLDEEIFAMQMRLRKAKTFIRQKDDIMEAVKQYPNLEKMDAGSDEEEIAQLLNFIEQTARKNGVSLSDVKPQPVKSDQQTKQYSVELNAESNLEALIRYVYDLEHSENLLRIDRVNIAPKDEKGPTLRAYLLITRLVVK